MYKIAIPSYRRVDIFQKKTLNYLKQTNINLDDVYLFVANEQEKENYSVLGLKNIIVGVETIKHQRNFIRKYFKEGEKVFSIDDDVAGIFLATSQKTFELVKDLNSLIDNGFKLCDKVKTKLWGVHAVKNALFTYNKQPSGDLRYIVGAAFGQIIDHDDFLAQTIDDKGDYERSIKYFIKFGSVIRFNNISIETNYYKSKGGMQETRTKDRVKVSGLYLLNQYPEYCEINNKKKNKEFFEIKLKYKPK
jgi:hypothetical protein